MMSPISRLTVTALRTGALITLAAWVCLGAWGTGKREVTVLKIQILHCTSCGFTAYAEQMAAELYDTFGVEADLVRGFNGNFDVIVNGEIIFSRTDTLRFPRDDEVQSEIRLRYRYDEAEGIWIRR